MCILLIPEIQRLCSKKGFFISQLIESYMKPRKLPKNTENQGIPKFKIFSKQAYWISLAGKQNEAKCKMGMYINYDTSKT